MSLADWLNSGWLTAHTTSRQEIADLMAIAERDIKDCQTPGLSSDWKHNIAYNAAIQLATAALAACGYRASREAHHFRVIQSLSFSINAQSKVVAQLEKFRKKRNIGGYERAGIASDLEAAEMLSLAELLRKEFIQWLSENHPELAPEGLLNKY